MGRKPSNQNETGVKTETSDLNPKETYIQAKRIAVGKNIRKYRSGMKLSVEELARYLELSVSYIGLLERGDRWPSLYIACKLCDLYGITAHELLTEEKGHQNRNKNEIGQEKIVVSLMRTLTEDKKSFAIETLKNLKMIGGS